MTVKTRVLQDHRGGSRIVALENCRFIYRDSEHDAVIVDLSHKGALLSSSFQPPTGEEIFITVFSNHLKEEFNLIGEVVRGTTVMVGYDENGKKGRFAVRFTHTPPELLNFIVRLNGP